MTLGYAPWLGVVGESLPVDDYAIFVADDPRVVPRRHDREVARPVLDLLAVVHHDRHATGDEVARVRGLAAVGAGDRLDVR